MKLKKLTFSISAKDILKIAKIQNKINIYDVIINDELYLNGSYFFNGININFQITASIYKVVNSIIYLDIKNIKFMKINLINSITKKIINYITSSFTEINGISFEDEKLKIEALKLINDFNYNLSNNLNLDNLEINDVHICGKEIEVTISGVDIIIPNKDNIPYVEAEIVSEIN